MRREPPAGRHRLGDRLGRVADGENDRIGFIRSDDGVPGGGPIRHRRDHEREARRRVVTRVLHDHEEATPRVDDAIEWVVVTAVAGRRVCAHVHEHATVEQELGDVDLNRHIVWRVRSGGREGVSVGDQVPVVIEPVGSDRSRRKPCRDDLRSRVRAAVIAQIRAREENGRVWGQRRLGRIGVRILDPRAHGVVDPAVAVRVEQRAGIAGLARSGPERRGVPAPEELVGQGVVVIAAHLRQVDLISVDVVDTPLVDDCEKARRNRCRSATGTQQHRQSRHDDHRQSRDREATSGPPRRGCRSACRRHRYFVPGRPQIVQLRHSFSSRAERTADMETDRSHPGDGGVDAPHPEVVFGDPIRVGASRRPPTRVGTATRPDDGSRRRPRSGCCGHAELERIGRAERAGGHPAWRRRRPRHRRRPQVAGGALLGAPGRREPPTAGAVRRMQPPAPWARP